jgi:hypothetical protein
MISTFSPDRGIHTERPTTPTIMNPTTITYLVRYDCLDEYSKRYSKGSRDIEEGCKIIGIVSKTDILNVVSENQKYTHNLAKAAVK